MTGEIARAITLTTFGNAFLQDDYDISGLTLEHTSFNFTNKVEFLYYKKHWFGKPTWHRYADNPIEWLKKLKQEGYSEIRMIFQSDNSIELDGEKVPDHKLAAFVGGGGNRFLQTIRGKSADVWHSKDEVTDRDSSTRKIWAVIYGRTLTDHPFQEKNIYIIDDLKEKLRISLTNISSFAKEQDQSFWAQFFERAIEALDSQNSYEAETSNQVIPKERDISIHQLLSAASGAWCFGGMGSWNDIGFTEKDKQDLYDRLTAELYDIVNLSYLAVGNS